VNETFTYDYLLSPAKHWAHFGQLHLTIHAPPRTQLHASLPLTQDGDVYRGDYPALPETELSLDVMTRKGLILGMTQPSGYWMLLFAVVSIASAAASARLGRVWRGAPSRLGRALRCVFGTGLIVGVVNGLVIWLGVVVFPERAFGIGYGASFGLMLLFFGATAFGVSVSIVTASVPKK
jgi:hypothetical protein